MDQVLYIQTQRLELLPCSLEVAQAAIAKNTPLVEKHLAAFVPEEWYTADVQGFLPTYMKMLEADPSHLGYGVWLIIRTDDSTLIGDVSFGGKSEVEDSLELGYEVLRAYHNQGYATEAVQALVDFAFTQLEIKKVTAHTPEDNAASIQIMEKLGMQNLGIEVSNSPGVKAFRWEMTLESRRCHN